MSRTAYPGDQVAFTLLDAAASTAYTIALRRLSDNTLVVGPTTTGVTEQDPGGPSSNYTGLVTVPAGAAAGDYQGEFSFGGNTYADEELLEVLAGPVLTGVTVLQSLVDHRPPDRHDAVTWTRARVEYAMDFDGPWFEVQTTDLDPVDEDASKPGLRSYTVEVDSGALWLRIVWLDGDDLEEAGVVIAAGTVPYIPTLAHVETELRARLKDASGNEIGMFSEDETIDVTAAEAVIAAAVRDVAREFGSWVPGPVIDDARRAAALRAAANAERSFLPEQSSDDRSGYQLLHTDADTAVASVAKRLRALRMIGLSGRILA